jgi:hypothetical protein
MLLDDKADTRRATPSVVQDVVRYRLGVAVLQQVVPAVSTEQLFVDGQLQCPSDVRRHYLKLADVGLFDFRWVPAVREEELSINYTIPSKASSTCKVRRDARYALVNPF